MTKRKTVLLFGLVILLLACSLTDPQSAALVAKLEPAPTQQASPTPTSSPLLCTVSTGTPGGKLRLRDCGSTQCQELEILDEGEMLTVKGSGDWLSVVSSSGRSGWINSKFCKLEK